MITGDTLKIGALQGPAQEVPHAVEGMVLRWVAHGEGPRAERVYLQPNEPEEFTRVITNQTRPVTMGFAHPWQVSNPHLILTQSPHLTLIILT